jgi:acyl phosphate:glycerol-3-phosphate acyltransferase
VNQGVPQYTDYTATVPVLWTLVLLAYLLGSIPFGFLLVRARSGKDIRAMGSGNIGATNVARTSGWSVGVATLVLDTAKGFFAVWLMERLSGNNIRFMMLAALAAIAGHIFPVWLRFSGGKGVATAAGAFLAISWPAVVATVVVFFIVALFWRYVSLASVSAAASLPLLVYILYAPSHAPPVAVSAGTLLAAALIILKHKENIHRLMAGTEPRFVMGRKRS